MIRIKILQLPPIADIDGIRLDRFEVGREYEFGNSLGALFLAEGWGEPVPLDAPKPHEPFTLGDLFDTRVLDGHNPPNLKREQESPVWERAVAADAARSKPPRARRG